MRRLKHLVLILTLLALPYTAIADDKIAVIDVDPAQKLMLEYDVYWSGFRVASAIGETKFSDDAYNIAVAVRTRGIAKLFVNGKSLAKANGAITEDGRILPTYYNNDGMWNKKRYARTLTFFPDGSVDQFEFIRPQEKDEETMEWEPVPEELRRGPDPISLLFNASRDPWGLVQRQKNADGLPVLTSFDGIRTIEYQVDCDPEIQPLKKSRRSIYKGSAILCEVADRQTAGFYIEKNEKKRRKEKKRRAKAEKEKKPVRLWLAPAEGTPWYVPVRIEMRGDGKNIKAYLTSIGNVDTVTEAKAQTDG